MSKRQIGPEKAQTGQTERAQVRSEQITKEKAPMIFDKSHYMYMAGGAVLVALGLMLMSGGQQPDANTWDPNIIYSTRIVSISPIVVLAGLAVTAYGIFKN